VRGDYAIDVGRNVCHGSDAVDTAIREIGLWSCPRSSMEHLLVPLALLALLGGMFQRCSRLTHSGSIPSAQCLLS
jgi:hypothetical protein